MVSSVLLFSCSSSGEFRCCAISGGCMNTTAPSTRPSTRLKMAIHSRPPPCRNTPHIIHAAEQLSDERNADVDLGLHSGASHHLLGAICGSSRTAAANRGAFTRNDSLYARASRLAFRPDAQ